MRNRRTKDAIFEESLFNNLQDYRNFECRLIDMAIGRFNIKNLPKEIYEPYVIRQLILRNEVLFFKDDIADEYVCYEFTQDGAKLSKYMQPLERRVQFPNGATYHLTDKDSVIIKGSLSGTHILPIIKQYARKLYVISRTIDINVHSMRTPTVLLCDNDSRLSFENLFKQYEGFAPVIKGSNDLDLSNITSLNLNATPVFNQLYQLQQNIWNEFLCFIGVSAVNTQKKERLISSEVENSLGGNYVERNNFCSAIKRGLDECNAMYGLDMKLMFCNEEYTDEVKEEQPEEGDINE